MRATRNLFRTLSTALLLAGAAFAATPPGLLNYQGVLRDSADQPLNGGFDMTFRFFTADIAGDEILVDVHNAANGNPVTVSGGLFSVALGGGAVSDGSGPGTYTSLAEVFRDHAAVWLSVQVGAEVLTPRVRVLAAGYALNARQLDGQDSTFFLNTSSTAQTKSGALVVDASATSWGVTGYGGAGGGYFKDVNGSGYAGIGFGDFGVQGFGNTAGAYFDDLDQSGYAYVAYGDHGIQAYGSFMGGYFKDADQSGSASVGFGDLGIQGTGNTAGGYFKDADHSGYAYVGMTDDGIRGYGSLTGGYFEDLDQSGWARVGFGDTGIEAYGNTSGGFFQDSNQSGWARVGAGDYGIQGYGNFTGGYFKDLDHSGYSRVGYGDTGIEGYGNASGGYFQDLNGSGWAQVGSSTYKVSGSGAVSFVQNHPERSDQVVVYHAPEASEVAVYTRGRGRLKKGVATLALDETFQWVANPDLGLTAHLTPRGPDADLHVVSVSTTELLVAGARDIEFDYMVWGLRLGFEELPPVQPKRRESFIPSMSDHRELYAADSSLRRFNAFERFRDVEAELRGVERASLNLSRSASLVARIGEYDAAVHGAIDRRPADDSIRPQPASDAAPDDRPAVGSSRAWPATASEPPKSMASARPAGGVHDTRTDEEAFGTTTWLPVTEPVEAGDVLALDPLQSGFLRRAAAAADPGVVGIAAGPSRAKADGGLEAPLAGTRYAMVHVDAGFGEIRAGDLLVASPTPGRAMRALEIVPGTLLGKALEGLEAGTGRILIVVLLR